MINEKEAKEIVEDIRALLREELQTEWIKSPNVYMGQVLVINKPWFDRWLKRMKAIVGEGF